MMFNPYQAQRLAKERVKDAMREAKQARLTRAAKTPGRWGMAAAGALDPPQSIGSLHAIAELMNHAAGLGPSHRARPG